MFQAVDTPELVPDDGSFRTDRAPTEPPEEAPGKKERRERLEAARTRLDALQNVLFADNRWSVLLIFQAMDAAGKDGAIRAVLTGVNPAGCQVFAFKAPTPEELDHDFLWRTTTRLPERGRIGVFNRSYYEEVLVVRVHPEYLEGQRLPGRRSGEKLWRDRLASIREHEEHLARNGTVVLKFWLNVSKDEQRRRFLARIDEPEKNWKFAAADVRERGHWVDYMNAYQDALRETSRPWAPWYAIPADSKSWARWRVADIVVRSLERLDLRYPEVGETERARFAELRAILENDGA